MLKLSDQAVRQRHSSARSHVEFNGEAAVNGLDVIPHWLTAEDEPEVLPSPSRRRWRAIFRQDHLVMLLLAGYCGLNTLSGFVRQKFDAWPVVAALFYIEAYISGGWFASIQLGRDLRQGRFDINLLMIVVAMGAAAIGAWALGGTLLFLFSLSNGLVRFAKHRTEQTISRSRGTLR